MRVLVAGMIAAGCVSSNTVTCPDGRTCPADRVCAEIAVTQEKLCADRASMIPCDGLEDRTPCVLGVTEGTCYSGICLPVGCGNQRSDAGEQCDDGNNVSGDGCSADCLSAEVCGNAVLDAIVLDEANRPVPDEQCDDGVTTSRDGCSSGCELENARWEPIETQGPPARAYTAATYDQARGRVVMFGGSFLQSRNALSSLAYNDTWEWNGVSWRRLRMLVAPTQRFGHGLAYDPVTTQIILFGGFETGPVADTWVLEGDVWRPVVPAASPPPRSGHAMAYHPALGIVLFGGHGDAGEYDDTWVWDGTTWQELVFSNRPEARTGASLSLDPARGVLVLAGGSNAVGDPVATWELASAGWTQVADAASSPQVAEAALGYDPSAGAMILFAGRAGNQPVESVAVWDGAAWVASGPKTSPGSRVGAVFFSDPVSGLLQMFGGYTYVTECLACSYLTYAEHWEWASDSWRDKRIVEPPPRAQSAFALDTRRRHVVMYGGTSADAALADTWRFDGHGWQLFKPSVAPPARSAAAMAYDSRRDTMVLFGGIDGSSVQLTGTWLLSDGQWEQSATNGSTPDTRRDHAMAEDPKRARVVMFGGYDNATGFLNDTWEWDGSAWTSVSPSGPRPGPRSGHVMAYDPIRERVVLFGGVSAAGTLRDLWEWDGATWSERTLPQTVSPRQWTGLAWNAARRRMILFGGRGTAPLNDTYELTPQGWAAIPINSETPEPRDRHIFLPSPDGGGVIAVGGQAAFATELGDAWRFSWTADTTYESCRRERDDDGDMALTCSDDDCWHVCTPACPPGAVCDPGAPRCGDMACNTALENCRNCPADCLCDVRCGDLFCDAPAETSQTCPGDCGL